MESPLSRHDQFYNPLRRLRCRAVTPTKEKKKKKGDGLTIDPLRSSHNKQSQFILSTIADNPSKQAAIESISSLSNQTTVPQAINRQSSLNPTQHYPDIHPSNIPISHHQRTTHPHPHPHPIPSQTSQSIRYTAPTALYHQERYATATATAAEACRHRLLLSDHHHHRRTNSSRGE